MQATKASAPLFLLAALVAVWCACRGRKSDGLRRFSPRNIGVILLSALVTAVLFYSSFGTHLAGLTDAVSTYGLFSTRLASGATGHEKPWWYYLQLFSWQRNGGLVFEQVAFSLLALVGCVAAVFAPLKTLRWAALYTLLVVVLLSFPAYKTPWHVIHFVPGLALLAAGTLHALAARSVASSPSLSVSLSAACASIVLVFLVRQTWLTSFLRPADPRNPYAYVHSSPDVLKYRALADAALARAPSQPIRVISEEYWPLPWYFRGLASVGYWSAPPVDCDGALVITSAQQAADVRARLRGKYQESILGLRPGFLCVVFTPSP
jgi:hypothetical protein